MSRRFDAALLLLAVTACAGKSEDPPAPPPHAPPDAAVQIVRPDPGPFDSTGVHLDEDAPPDRRPPRTGPAARLQHPIDVILRSTPPGAIAAVDGTPLGPTPRYWQGDANGREHEFTFTMKGYAFARYRFVPITSGVVHARLTVITDEAGANEPPPMVPPLADVPASPVATPGPTPIVVAPPSPTLADDAPTPLLAPGSAAVPPPAADAGTATGGDGAGGSARTGIGPQP